MTTRVAVLDDYQGAAEADPHWRDLPAGVEPVFFHDHLSEEAEVAERLRPFEVVAAMRERTPFPASLLARLPNLRLLVTTGMRNRSIDLAAALEQGIVVSGTEGTTRRSTAELAWGLILAVTRHIPAEERSVREGRWQTTVGTELAGRRLGLLGLGRIGTQMAAIARVFEMEPVAWSQNLTTDAAVAAGATRVDKEELLATSDVVSIHLVLSDRTRGLIGARELASMRSTAYLINTSRGPIVEETALVDALRRGVIAGAGLDVFDQEPLPPDHPLRRVPNAVVTPHLGYVTQETYAEFFAGIVDAITQWLAGHPVRQLTP